MRAGDDLYPNSHQNTVYCWVQTLNVSSTVKLNSDIILIFRNKPNEAGTNKK